MSSELELAAGASAGGFVRRMAHKHSAPVGTPCANCATPLQGPWCHACGQSGEDFHRSIVRLMAEVMEGLLHADGRLWRTLPDLMFRPGRLTRSFLEGHRAPQIPPLRLFLVVLLSIFLVGGLTSGGKTEAANAKWDVKMGNRTARVRTLSNLTPEERAKVQASVNQAKVVFAGDTPNAAATQWLKDRLSRTLADPERFYLILEQWSERFAILMLPVSALLLSLLFIFQRRFFLFDHTIFSLHSLSALGIMITLAMAASTVVDEWGSLFLLPAPVHLYVHMRGVYGTSVAGTLLRMFLLFVGSCFAAALLFVGLLAVGLNGMGT